ncbi:MAG TPA: O-antigen ligase family protein [Anaerolineae bacterium]|nr:O-antigen ligase family protein [Anaerolineae bacterium]
MTPSGSSNVARASRFNVIQLNLGAPTSSDTAVASRSETGRWNAAARFYRYVVVFSLPLIAALLFVVPVSPLSLIGVPLIFLLRWAALGSPIPFTRVNGAMLVFLLALMWGMLRAPDFSETTSIIARLLAGVVTLYVVVDYADRPSRVWNVAAALVVFGVTIALAAPFVTEPLTSKFINASFLFHPLSPDSIYVSNPNMVASALSPIVPLAVALIFQDERFLRVLGSISLAPPLIMLLLLQARGAIVAVITGLAVFGSLYRRWLIVLLILVGLILLGVDFARVRIPLSLGDFDLNPSSASSSLEGRQQVWAFSAALITQQPLGIGINAYPRYAAQVAGDFLTEPQREQAHNLFLQVGLEMGLVGLVAFTVLFTYALFASWHAYRRNVKRTLALGIFAALIVILVNGLFETNMWGNRSVVILWALFGMAIALGRFDARQRSDCRGSL